MMDIDQAENIRQHRIAYWLRHSAYVRWINPAIVDEPVEVLEQAMRREFRFMAWVVGLVVAYGAISTAVHWNDPPPPPPPEPTYVSAGNVQSISLHPTTFSTESTVITTAGTFAVHGGVSAAVGDRAEIKSLYPSTLNARELCITSSIKTACYRIE